MSAVVSTMDQILGQHRFFADFPPDFAELIAGCARNTHYKPGEYLAHESDRADSFFILSKGKVALEVAVPGKSPVVIATLGAQDVVGVSWLVAPYCWLFDARVMEDMRGISIDAKCLRVKCDADHDLGYEMMKRLLPVLTQRLHATRMQILDVYGKS
uniref:cyclic nucleotide-binding domain-containing protein n=1 Tax=Parerythrobacter lutipelagi TaxID=1964208 RepID=UPI0010F81467|nr:cyclic nucleotide-binding domain-containing protein [Parerythrobacter lutipelagi]